MESVGENVVKKVKALSIISVLLIRLLLLLPGYLHFFIGEIQASQVQQNLCLSYLGLCFGLVPWTVLRSSGTSVDHL